jgi:hypothetical protein
MLVALVGNLPENKSMMSTTSLAFMNFFMFVEGLDFDDPERILEIGKARTVKCSDFGLFSIVSLGVHRITS